MGSLEYVTELGCYTLATCHITCICVCALDVDCDQKMTRNSLILESVGRTDRNDNATVTVKTSNGIIEPVVTSNTSAKNSVTWADIVRNGKSVKGKQQCVVSSSFSRNNPVSKFRSFYTYSSAIRLCTSPDIKQYKVQGLPVRSVRYDRSNSTGTYYTTIHTTYQICQRYETSRYEIRVYVHSVMCDVLEYSSTYHHRIAYSQFKIQTHMHFAFRV